MELCVAMGGSISGEHGIGTEKSAYMRLVFSEEDIGLMLALREVWNPRGLLNPGKVLPASSGCGESSLGSVAPAGAGAWT
jgi:FAD/FMN-containing dehydrogenase